MKIVVTGSLGHISQPLAEALLAKAHSVTVISSKAEKQKDIEAMGAIPAIGSIDDVNFLAKTFIDADLVYLMEPPINFFDQKLDVIKHHAKIASNFKQAVQQSGVTKIVHLSSIGAHTNKGNGMLAYHYEVENILNELPQNVSIKFMRPVGFYYNMFAFIPVIKTKAVILSNYKTTYREPWVSPADIASVIAEEMELPFEGRKVRYIASDELTSDDVASILGEAIGNPGLQWTTIPNQQFLNEMIAAGFNKEVAKGLMEMNIARQNGTLFEDYHRNSPHVLGKVKLVDFAKEFAKLYHQ